MSDNPKDQDPIEMLRRMWSGAGVPLPGMVAPTLDIDELDKRIGDLRTVENWLRMNLNTSAADNPFIAAMWPWAMMQQTPVDPAKPAATPDKAPGGRKPRNRK